jgi:hypothetical protein
LARMTSSASRTSITGNEAMAAGRPTKPKVRRAIQASEEETNIALSKRHRVNRKTIAKWKARDFMTDDRTGRASLLTDKDEAIIRAYRWRTRLALNDSHLRLRCLIPKLSRSAPYRCLKRRGLSRIGSTATCPRLTNVYAEVAAATPENAAAFLGRLVDQSAQTIVAVTRHGSHIHRLENGASTRTSPRSVLILSPCPARPRGRSRSVALA